VGDAVGTSADTQVMRDRHAALRPAWCRPADHEPRAPPGTTAMSHLAQMRPLPRSAYDRDTETVARELLGTRIARRVAGVLRVGRIVETEAYIGPHDLAAHSSPGRAAR